MNKNLARFLQVVTVIISISVLAFLIWEPQVEGVNAHATNFEIYFKDPFLALVYVGSIAFFVGAYKVFKVLGYAAQNKASSPIVIKALQTIKRCALIIVGFVAVEELWIMLTHGNDDAAGAFMMGAFIVVGSIIVAAVAGKAQGKLQRVYLK